MSAREKEDAIAAFNSGGGSTAGGTDFGPAPIPDDGGGGGGGGGGGSSPDDIYDSQLDALNRWLGSTSFQEGSFDLQGNAVGTGFPGQLFGDFGGAGIGQAVGDLGVAPFNDGPGLIEDTRITGGGGAALPKDAIFSEVGIPVAGAPEWWKALNPDVLNPISEYQTFSNLLIPFLSPEDQRTVASNLFQSDPDQFQFYDPEILSTLAPPSEITPELRQQFFSGERAQKALDSFDSLLDISGRTAEDFGPGYNFLRGIADTLRDFKLTSGATQLTETQQDQLLSSLDPQLAGTSSRELSAFGPLAKSFSNPFFSAGSLSGEVKNRFGQLIQGPNPAFT